MLQGGDHWSRLEETLKFVSGNQQSAQLVLWVKHNDKVIYTSPDWPNGLAPEEFHVAETYEGPNAPKPGQPSPAAPRRGEPISPSNPALPLKSAQFSTHQSGATAWRVGVMGNPYMTLIVAANMADFDARSGPFAQCVFHHGHRRPCGRGRRCVVRGAACIASRDRAHANRRGTSRPKDSTNASQPSAVTQSSNNSSRCSTRMLDRLEKFHAGDAFQRDASHRIEDAARATSDGTGRGITERARRFAAATGSIQQSARRSHAAEGHRAKSCCCYRSPTPAGCNCRNNR